MGWGNRDANLSFPKFLLEARHCKADISGDRAEHWLLACRWMVPTGRHMGLACIQEIMPCLSSCQGKCYIMVAADEKVRERIRLQATTAKKRARQKK